METLTYFIENLFSEELGTESYQSYLQKSVSNQNYNEITISGAQIENCVFEDIIFENCIFWASRIDNCLFINCMFINCKFQFTNFSDCNFEAVSFENCIWGLSEIKGPESMINSDLVGNISFESRLPGRNSLDSTRTLSLKDFLICA